MILTVNFIYAIILRAKMNVTNKMINKQLRTAGRIYNLFIDFSRESKFRRNQKVLNWFLRGKKFKGLQCSETWIMHENGSKLRILIYKPLTPGHNAAGVLWIHGGGYGIGLPEMSAVMSKRLITAGNCVVIAPDYRLSIDSPYPAALEDCYDALLWMRDHAEELGIRDDQLIVGGESAGGGLTAALNLYARDKGEINIAFQIPLYPMIDDRMSSESAKENNAPVWNSDSNRMGWKLYLGELFGKDVPAYAAAARAKDYRNLPPAVTFVGDLETFRDETIEYVNNLRKAGVPADFQIYKGCYHAFDVLCPNAEVSKEAVSFLMKSFRYALDHYFAKQPAAPIPTR